MFSSIFQFSCNNYRATELDFVPSSHTIMLRGYSSAAERPPLCGVKFTHTQPEKHGAVFTQQHNTAGRTIPFVHTSHNMHNKLQHKCPAAQIKHLFLAERNHYHFTQIFTKVFGMGQDNKQGWGVGGGGGGGVTSGLVGWLSGCCMGGGGEG